jgi:hypothetical protein
MPDQAVALSNMFSTTDTGIAPITQYHVCEGTFGTPVGAIIDASGNVLPAFQNDIVSSPNGVAYKIN